MSNYKDHWTDEYVADLKMQLEEKYKEIDNLKTELYSNAKTALDNLQRTRNNFLEELESKDRELAQLKEIANNLFNVLQEAADKQLGDVNWNKGRNALTAYAEWCKQNLK